MGLRFRKSITLMKGVRLNFGLNGMSLSTGIPGFRKTFHTSGRVTTSVGIPGSGISYVTTSNANRTSRAPAPTRGFSAAPSDYLPPSVSSPRQAQNRPPEPPARSINTENLRTIHQVSDEPIDWTDVLISAEPTDPSYDREAWQYLHGVAEAILNGDIDTYLKVISDVNPLDDLLEFGGSFEFGTDDPRMIAVEYILKSADAMPSGDSMSVRDYNLLLHEFVCSCSIRVARDMLALLPVKRAVVHAVDEGKTILSAVFDRATMRGVNFNSSDVGALMAKFKHNMKFSEAAGFLEVSEIE